MADNLPKEEKTEEATPRRRQDSRERGQVAFSTELTAAAMLVAAALALVLGGSSIGSGSARVVVDMIALAGTMGPGEITIASVARLAELSAKTILPAVCILMVPMLACGIVTAYGQAGFQITPRAIAVDLAKIDPLKGLGRMFSARSLVRVGLSSAKLLFIVGAMVWAAAGDVPRLGALAGSELRPALAALGVVVGKCAAAALVAILVLALADLFYQHFQHRAELRMSRKEVQEELKETEGDPHIRSRIRAVQREMARRRMMADVPAATVVVTNPTHYAVALRYDRDEAARTGSAPRVVAKGVDQIALTIQRVAREANVPCLENPPLARALHAQTEIGDEIPADLFQAVAGVLAYVYRLRGEHATA
jgi:flagellar biosynthetic protein FlhB